MDKNSIAYVVRGNLTSLRRKMESDSSSIDAEEPRSLQESYAGLGSLLHIAVFYKQHAIVNYLLYHGADVNSHAQEWGMGPLHVGVLTGSCEIVKILCAAGADTLMRDNKGTTPLDLAMQCGNDEIERFLLSVEGNHRVRASPRVEATKFRWMGDAESVSVTGSFNSWRERVPLRKDDMGIFCAEVDVPPGKYVYKFVVDGAWRCATDQPSSVDDEGNENNVLIVVDLHPEA